MSEQQEQAGAAQAVEFDEAAYMVAFPRIAEVIRSGTYASALDHYKKRGEAEDRLSEPRYRRALEAQHALRALSPPAATAAARPRGGLDALLGAEGLGCVAIGWVDDRAHPLRGVALRLAHGRRIEATGIARNRRTDGEAIIGAPPFYLLGYWAILPVGPAEAEGATLLLDMEDAPAEFATKARLLPDAALRETVFEYLAGSTYLGNAAVEAFRQMDGGFGAGLIALNRSVSAAICRGAHVERHGPQRARYGASIIVCLCGRSEYLFLQAAFFSAGAGAGDCEFIYVCNSPELGEALQREARIAARIYGLSITLVLLPGNAGFASANNEAARHARSDRLMILNPDVFPRHTDWAAAHAHIVNSLPAEQTRLFGAPLFYDDGSLMHAGMFLAVDSGLSAQPGAMLCEPMLRVEHYGKGAPPDTPLFRSSRAVPAVTGAFMAADRATFEALGGFSEDYAFGHYEDADLCLKAWRAGHQVWIHDLPFWHLEGKGSVRRPVHEGGSTLNRWHFTRTWLNAASDGFPKI